MLNAETFNLRSGWMRLPKWCLLILLAAACKQVGSGESVRAQVAAEQAGRVLPSRGEKRLSGEYTELRASPNGAVLTALKDASTPRGEGIPPALKVGELWAAQADGGVAKAVGASVQNGPGGWLTTADSQWLLVIQGWSPQKQTGTLQLVDLRSTLGEPKRIADDVSYFVPSADGSLLAYVQSGVLHVGPIPDGPFAEVASEVVTAEFSGKTVYFQRRVGSGGGLFQSDLRTPPKLLVDNAASYNIVKDGTEIVVLHRQKLSDRDFHLQVINAKTRKARLLARDALMYAVPHSAEFIAWRTRRSSGKGALAEVGDLFVSPLLVSKPRQVATFVKDFGFSASGRSLAYRANYVELPLGGPRALPGESRTEAVGDLYVLALPDGKPRLLGKRSPNFLFARGKDTLAYALRLEEPLVTRMLYVLPSEAKEPKEVKDWIYEYQFRPGDDDLVYRADCTREGRSCTLYALGTGTSQTLAEQNYGVRFSSDGARAVLSEAHLTDTGFDLFGLSFARGAVEFIDPFVRWPPVLLGPGGEHVAFIVEDPKRRGVYVAAIP